MPGTYTGIVSEITMSTRVESKFTPLEQLWYEHAIWSQQTFGSDYNRGPIGSLKHLEKEAKEAYESDPVDEVEIADCFLLVLDAARRAGMTLELLVDRAAAKLEVNKKRKWGATGLFEPVEHVRKGESNTKNPPSKFKPGDVVKLKGQSFPIMTVYRLGTTAKDTPWKDVPVGSVLVMWFKTNRECQEAIILEEMLEPVKAR